MVSELIYIKEVMKGQGNFTQSWKELPEEDREQLKRWAREEQQYRIDKENWDGKKETI